MLGEGGRKGRYRVRMQTRSSPARAGNLPAELTSFVGRKTDIAEVKQLLSTSRLVTLIGSGGVGKTRLLLKVARELRRAFADGVWLIELADVTDPDLVAPTVAEELGVTVPTRGSALASLSQYVSDRRVLVLLDNCEHVLEPVAELVAELLRASPDLRVMTTSIQPLRVEGERLYVVAPLETPDPEFPLVPGTATQYSSMALFVERASAVVPGFTLDQDNERAVAQVVQRLEGIPLAIELAAVSSRVMSIQEIAARLDERFDLLTTGPRTAPDRHQTLDATLTWSFDLCLPVEQLLWARCSVFAGPFDRFAAEQICGDDELDPDTILGVIAGLVDKSVLSRTEADGQVRFAMTEMMRQYGLRHLRAADEERRLRTRHADYFTEVIEEAARNAFGPGQASWLQTLRRDHANLRAALDFTLATPGLSGTGLHLAATAWFYWVACGQLLEGRLWLERALERDHVPSRDRGTALWASGFIAVLQGDHDAATKHCDAAAAIAAEIDDDLGAAAATHVHGLAALFTGDLALAQVRFVEAEQQYQDSAPGLVALLLVHRGLAALFDDRLAEATTLVDRARQCCLAQSETWVLSYALQAAGLVEFVRGDLASTSALVAESVTLKRPLHDTLGIAVGLDILSWVAAAELRYERAATLMGAAHRVWGGVGEPVFGSKNFAALRGRAEERIRREADDTVRGEAYARGAGFDFEQATSYALDEPEPPPADADRVDPAVGLTRRESEVAELLGQGMSNKEIAAALVISQRTAEGHVQRILTKFGFTSRAQVATWVAGQRLSQGA